MSFKSRKPPEMQPIPPQPPAPELMDVIDEISGVQTITVVGPDGKKRRHTQRLPLTPQEQSILSQAENLISQSLSNIQTLYKYDPSSIVNYQPFIQAFSGINAERMQDLSNIGNFKDIAEKVEQFRNINRDLALREFDIKERETENTLARRGISRSSEANDVRAALAKEKALLTQELDVNAQNYGEDLQNRQLDRETRLYNLREAGRQGRLSEAQTGYELEKQKLADVEAARRGAIDENLTLMDLGQGLKSGSDALKSNAALANSQNALGIFSAQANNQNQRYANEITRITGNHNAAMNKFNSTPASFGKRLGDMALSLGGYAVGGPIGAAVTTAATSLNKGPENPGAAPNFGTNTRRREAFTSLSSVGR